MVGGRIKKVDTVRFDSPRPRVFDAEDGGLCWYSVTCGYRSGILLELAGGNDVTMEFVVNTSVVTGPLFGESGISAPMRMSYAPADKIALNVGLKDPEKGPVTMEIGGDEPASDGIPGAGAEGCR